MSELNLKAHSTHDRAIIERAVDTLKPYVSNARTHSKKQLKQIASSIERFGFVNPVLIGDDDSIIEGHGRVEAAKLLGRKTVPTLEVSHLSDAERRAYILADNKLALNAGWDNELLALELQGLLDDDFDLELTGFNIAEIDFIIEDAASANPDAGDPADDEVPDIDGPAVTRMGDLWLLGSHKLICGDAQDGESFHRLVGNEQVDLLLTDPPYNVKIDGNVCGLGSVKHREFAFASGEMSEDEFTGFLRTTLGNASSIMRDGAIAYVCMDWRHMGEMLAAGTSAFTELKNLVVWNKTNGGMGAFYRSKHELIFVFKKGTAPHTNSFGLGETGRYRTNVWDHAGISSISASRGDELAMHPTIKPVAMIADAMLSTGPLATSVAIIAIALIGFAMLAGRIDWRRGATTIVGCFILFGAPAIAQALIGLSATGPAEVVIAERSSPAPPPAPPAPDAQDPYSGASIIR